MGVEIRPARSDDLAGIRRCVEAAYALYLPRMDQPPAPMTADYATLLADQAIQVVEQEGTIQALMVLFERRDHLFIENIAVLPDAQGAGLGSALLRLAEGRAREAALPEVRFYTNEAMTENIGYYERRGYEISGREEEDGFGRVYFRKRVG